MPNTTPNELQIDVLRDALTTLGITGITIDATAYPDASDALLLVKDLINAVEVAQADQQANTPAGEGVEVVVRATGPNQQTEDPPGSGTFLQTRPVVLTLEYDEVVSVTDVVPRRV